MFVFDFFVIFATDYIYLRFFILKIFEAFALNLAFENW